MRTANKAGQHKTRRSIAWLALFLVTPMTASAGVMVRIEPVHIMMAMSPTEAKSGSFSVVLDVTDEPVELQGYQLHLQIDEPGVVFTGASPASDVPFENFFTSMINPDGSLFVTDFASRAAQLDPGIVGMIDVDIEIEAGDSMPPTPVKILVGNLDFDTSLVDGSAAPIAIDTADGMIITPEPTTMAIAISFGVFLSASIRRTDRSMRSQKEYPGFSRG